MTPSSWTRLAFKAEKTRLERTGLFEGNTPDVADLVVATDASGGPHSRDPRLRAVGWAVVIARRQGQSIDVLGTLSGVIMPPATVPQGEHMAIIEAIRHTTGKMDLTTDCKGVLKTLQSTHPHKKTFPEWGDVWHQKDRVQANWVRAHKEAEVFDQEFPQQEWRRLYNVAADELAGRRARDALSPHAARRVHEVDRIATEVNDLLASRAEWQLQNKENEYVPRAVRETLTQFDKSQRPHSKALYTNKRSRLKQMLIESSQGHTWQYTRGEDATNLQLKCTVCGLWVQQTYSQETFQKVDAQPCRGFPSQGPRFWPTIHPSHIWFSAGKTWECSGCGVGFGPAVAKVPNKATKLCSKNCLGNKLSFAKASLPRTEAQTSSSPFGKHEVTVPAKATGSGTLNSACPLAVPPPPKHALSASCQLFFTKASSPRTEQPQPKSSLGKHEATVQAKATAPQVPEDAISFLHGGPPQPKENSSVGTERIGDRRLHVDINVPKPKAPAKARAKAKPKNDPKQTLLMFAASGSASKHGAQERGPFS